MHSYNLAAAAAALALTIAPAAGHDGMVHEGCPTGQSFLAGELAVSAAFTRATLPDAPVGAGYMSITNAGADDDRLVSVTSEITPTIELHTMSIEDGMMKMAQLEDGIALPAGETVSLAPGGLHIMFIGPNQPFIEGECVEVTLMFEGAGALPIMLNVGPIGARGAPEGHEHGHDHGHGLDHDHEGTTMKDEGAN